MTDPMGMGGGMEPPMPPEADAGGDMSSPGLDAMMQAVPQVLEQLQTRGLQPGTPEFNKAVVEELQNMGFAVKDPQFLGQVLQMIGAGQALPDAAGPEMGGDPMEMAPPPMPPGGDPPMGF